MAQATEIERLLVRLVGNAQGYLAELEKARRATDTFEKKMGKNLKRIGASMKSLGRTLSIGLTAPLAVIGGLATREFAKFDKAMTESTSIMAVTEQQVLAMRDAALSLSGTEVLQAPDELARSYFFLASAGKSAAQSMALLPRVSKFATAGAFDMALATDLLTDAQSALGLSSKNVAQDTENLTRVSDVLVKANTLANASVQQFATALTSKTGAALKAFNKDIEEGVAVLAALADQGVKAELAGASLDRLIRLLSKSSIDNAKAQARLGFSVFDAGGKMRNFADIIENLEFILGDMTDQTKVATLAQLGFAARVQQVILPLLGTSDAIRKYEEQLRKAGGTTDDVANQQMQAFSNQMKQVVNQMKTMGIEIGSQLAPKLRSLTDVLKGVVDWWKRLSERTKGTIVSFGLILASIGPLILALGTLITTLGVYTIAANAATAAGGRMAASIVLMTRAMKGFLVLGLAAVMFKTADAVGLFGRNVDDLQEKIDRLGKSLKFQLDVNLENLEKAKGVKELDNQLKGLQRQLEFVNRETVNLRETVARKKGGAADIFSAVPFVPPSEATVAAERLEVFKKQADEIRSQILKTREKLVQEVLGAGGGAGLGLLGLGFGIPGGGLPAKQEPIIPLSEKFGKNTKKLEADVKKFTKGLVDQFKVLRTDPDILALSKLRERGATEAQLSEAKRILRETGAFKDRQDAAQKDLFKPPTFRGRAAVGGIQAAVRGSAEAAARISAAGAGPQERTAKATERLVELQEERKAQRLLEVQDAGLVGLGGAGFF